MRPFSRTKILSACRIVDSRCAIRIVMPSCSRATSRMVRLTSSSVRESSDEVASSNTSNCGFLSKARAMDSRCFSPPESFTPPSPITVSSPRSARSSKLWTDAFCSTSKHSASLAPGFTNCKFSRMDPEKSCESCVTNPILSRNKSRSMRFPGMPL